MICKKNHSHLPVLLKSSFLVFFLFFFLFSLNTKCLAQIAPHCISYFTCHYQSGTGLNCPQGTQPFHACYCWVDSAGCRKVQNDFCTTQDWCDFLIRYASLCREYGDCCGCSGAPQPTPTPGGPTPTPSCSTTEFVVYPFLDYNENGIKESSEPFLTKDPASCSERPQIRLRALDEDALKDKNFSLSGGVARARFYTNGTWGPDYAPIFAYKAHTLIFWPQQFIDCYPEVVGITKWSGGGNITPGTYQLVAGDRYRTYHNDPTDRNATSTYPFFVYGWNSFCTPIFLGLKARPLVSSWFQTQEGDVHAGGTIISRIPSGVTSPYFSLTGSGGYHGVVSWGSEGFSPSFGSGEVSQDPAWLANTSAKRNSYEFFYQLLDKPTLEEPPLPDGEIKNEDLTTDGIKAYNGNIKTGNTWQIGTKKIVILTSGKFLIKHRILVDQGGSLVVIAKEGIGVSKNLIATGEQNNYLGGFFIADGTFYSSVEEDFNFTPVTSEKVLVIQGGVIANDFELSRDLEDNSTPAEKFIYRPDMFLNIHSSLWRRAHVWEEIAP